MGFSEVLVLVAILIILFSARKIPALLGSMGKSIKTFKAGVKGEEDPRPSRDVEELKKKK